MHDRIGAVIVAAGLSSRMKNFKPLLTVDDTALIEMVIKNFQSVGVSDIIIVTGYRSCDIEQKLSGSSVKFVKNEHYESTHMFDSICLGLEESKKHSDYVFLTPADSPFVQKYTLNKMVEEIKKDEYSLIQPCFKEINGHPVLMKNDAIEQVLKHDGLDGLRGAISNMGNQYKNMKFIDPGIVMDADMPNEYLKLVEFNLNRHCPSIELCCMLQDYFFMAQAVKDHSNKVAEVAISMSETLHKKGIKLDDRIILSSCLLHDIAKKELNHAVTGASWLKDMGYDYVAEIVKEHMELDCIPEKISEKEVVYLADKLVQGDISISIEEKYNKKKEFYKNDKAALLAIEKREKQAMKIFELIYKKE